MKEEESTIFNDNRFPLDLVHVKGVMPFSNINQELFKKYYSPSAVSVSILQEAFDILKGFYGNHLFDKDSAKVYFPTRTCDPILILYQVHLYSDGHYETRKTAPYSMCVAIAPRARLDDEKCDQFPMLSDLEKKEKESKFNRIRDLMVKVKTDHIEKDCICTSCYSLRELREVLGIIEQTTSQGERQ